MKTISKEELYPALNKSRALTAVLEALTNGASKSKVQFKLIACGKSSVGNGLYIYDLAVAYGCKVVSEYMRSDPKARKALFEALLKKYDFTKRQLAALHA